MRRSGILTSPSYGFEDVWRSQFLFGIGRLFDLSPVGLVKLAAFFATLKLAVAFICALHFADRARCFMRGQPNSEILEAGLILVVLISIASVRVVGAQRRFDARAYLSAAICCHCDGVVHIRTQLCAPCRNVGSQAAVRSRCGRDEGGPSTSRLKAAGLNDARPVCRHSAAVGHAFEPGVARRARILGFRRRKTDDNIARTQRDIRPRLFWPRLV